MTRRLYRNKQDKMLGGVAAGLASYFDIDPVLTRLGFIVLTFLHGLGLIAYVILWIVVPARQEEVALASTEGPMEASATEYDEAEENLMRERISAKRSAFLGSALIVIGTLFLLDNLIPGFDFEELWPVLMIAAGVGLLWNTITKSPFQQEEEI